MAAILLHQERATWRGVQLCHHRVALWCRPARRQTSNRHLHLNSSNKARASRCAVTTRHQSTHIYIHSLGWTSRQQCNSRRKGMRGLRLQHRLYVTRPASSVSNMVPDTRSFLRGPYLRLLILLSQCGLPQVEVPIGRNHGLTIQIIPRRRQSHTHALTWSDPTQHSLSR